MEKLARNNEVSRRGFLDYLLGGSILAFLASILYPIISYLKPAKIPEASVSMVKAGNLSEIPVNSSKIIKFGNKPAILIRTPKNEFKGFIAVCTHLDCTVQYKPDDEVIWCACHNGRYDLNGINIAGPPPRPLINLIVTIKDQEIYISRER